MEVVGEGDVEMFSIHCQRPLLLLNLDALSSPSCISRTGLKTLLGRGESARLYWCTWE